MGDRTMIGLGVLLLALVSLACNAFAGRPDSSLPPPPIPATSPATAEAPEELPGLAPTATLSPEFAPVEAQGTLRILVDLNVRSGPGVRFDRVGFLLKDERVTVIGRDPASGWWRIQCPPEADGSNCWVSGGSQFTLLESGG